MADVNDWWRKGIGGGCEGKDRCWFWDEEGVYYREIGVGVLDWGIVL